MIPKFHLAAYPVIVHVGSLSLLVQMLKYNKFIVVRVTEVKIHEEIKITLK